MKLQRPLINTSQIVYSNDNVKNNSVNHFKLVALIRV